MLVRTYTRTYNARYHSNPYQKCRKCNEWIDGALDAPGPLTLIPCEHQSDYRDLCPGWSPVDGCTCPTGTHEMRPRPVYDDGHHY